mmetsp:Transcript_13568/g.18931  ORF Transcript_13568/g.18931 Transcript_13568/m.18931 type:complete len:321 (+) Transcript_13568:1736-2698(+)
MVREDEEESFAALRPLRLGGLSLELGVLLPCWLVARRLGHEVHEAIAHLGEPMLPVLHQLILFLVLLLLVEVHELLVQVHCMVLQDDVGRDSLRLHLVADGAPRDEDVRMLLEQVLVAIWRVDPLLPGTVHACSMRAVVREREANDTGVAVLARSQCQRPGPTTFKVQWRECVPVPQCIVLNEAKLHLGGGEPRPSLAGQLHLLPVHFKVVQELRREDLRLGAKVLHGDERVALHEGRLHHRRGALHPADGHGKLVAPHNSLEAHALSAERDHPHHLVEDLLHLRLGGGYKRLDGGHHIALNRDDVRQHGDDVLRLGAIS